MEELFLSLLNVSITAGWLVLAILLLRLVFRKAPRWMFCVLWALVGVRLLLPFSIESVFSLIPSAQTVPEQILYQTEPKIDSGFAYFNNTVNPVISGSFAPTNGASVNPLQVYTFIAAWLWVFGLAAMLLYALVSWLRLKHRIGTATLLRDNIRCSENVSSPFVLGLIRPKIYLPYGMDDKNMDYVIRHEQAHITRRDHLIKPIGFAILAVYWFNPLMWIAYILLCRDIELACDEKVIHDMNESERREYSSALLDCSIPRHAIAACPLAFGEVGIKERIRSVMGYKKAAAWMIAAAVVICLIAAVCFLTDPAGVPLSDVEWGTGIGEDADAQDFELVELTSYGTVCGLDRAQFDDALEFITDIRVSRREISLDRGEDRDATHTIILFGEGGSEKNAVRINISADYSSLWVSDGVKPSLSYRVIHPDEVEAFFEMYFGGAAVSGSDAQSTAMKIEAAVQYYYIGYSHNGELAISADTVNRELIDNDAAAHLPLMVIDSFDAFEQFYERYDHYYNLDDAAVGMRTAYDAAFFEDNTLIIVCMTEPSGSVRHSAFAVRQDDRLIVLVERISPEGDVYTNDMATWFVALEVKRSDIDGCTVFDAQPGAQPVTAQKYVYTNSGLPFQEKSGFILRSDGTFQFHWSTLSSYIGFGSYRIEDGRLILETDDQLYTYVFTAKDDGFVFDAANSSPMPTYRYSPDSPAQSPVHDGAFFRPEQTAE